MLVLPIISIYCTIATCVYVHNKGCSLYIYFTLAMKAATIFCFIARSMVSYTHNLFFRNTFTMYIMYMYHKEIAAVV